MAGMTEPLGSDSTGTVKIGPFLSSNDGKTPLTSLTITQSDVQLSKNNSPFAQKDQTGNAVHDVNGWYDIPLNSNDVSETGKLIVAVDMAAALPVWQRFDVQISASGVPQQSVHFSRLRTKMTGTFVGAV